jgi:uncharacterized protein YbaR (Trm112 family)
MPSYCKSPIAEEIVVPIVTCPECRKRYDPGMDEELEALGSAASLKVVCPACGQWLRLPENEAIPAPRVPPEILKGMMSQSRLIEDDSDESRSAKHKTTPAKRKPWWKFW